MDSPFISYTTPLFLSHLASIVTRLLAVVEAEDSDLFKYEEEAYSFVQTGSNHVQPVKWYPVVG